MDALIREARALLFLAPKAEGIVAPSSMWCDSEDFTKYETAEELIHRLTSINRFTSPRHKDDPEARRIASELMVWAGPLQLEESLWVNPNMVWFENNRRLSTAFLYEYCKTRRIDEHVNPDSILEIGAGYGGLARCLLATKYRRYVIIDLPESLYCSYVYLRTHRPDLKMAWAESHQFLPSADVVFVPASYAHGIEEEFDLGINTCSLGEMRPETRDHYLNIFARTCRHIYSHNRYQQGHQEGFPDICEHVEFDPNVWAVWLKNTDFVHCEPANPPSVEVLARRLNG